MNFVCPFTLLHIAMTDGKDKQESLSRCCISHEFYKAASRTPNKIAVIHARSGPRIAAQFRQFYDQATAASNADADERIGVDKLFDEFTRRACVSTHPPIYDGDECFTYSQILAAVDSLSRRLRHVLDGGDDPYLIKPSPDNLPVEQSLNDDMSGTSNCSDVNVEQPLEFPSMLIPRILGIYMVPSVEYVIAVLSVMRCGEAFMPLDPSWPKQRILSALSSSNADLIIWCSSSFDDFSNHQLHKSNWLVDCSRRPILVVSIKGNLQENYGSGHLLWPCENDKPRVFCYLMYTSGSTGKPKGVCGSEPGLLNRFSWMQELYPLNGEEYLLFKTSISFIDHLQEFLGSLLTTCTLVVPPFDELKENLISMIHYLQAYSISRLVVVPSLMRAILPSLQSPFNVLVKSSLKLLVLSGEILHLSLWHILSELLPSTKILNFYGSTEVSGDCTYFDCKRLPSILETEKLSSVPIGIPIPNCDVVLVSEDATSHGEIYVGGICLALGYFFHPVITALDVVKLHHESGSGCSMGEQRSLQYFRTGDFAKQLQSGDLVCIGRKDRTIKVNGQRVALEEIECTLRGHPDVVNAAVISDNCRGEIVLLEAYIVKKQIDDSDETFRSSLRSWLVEKLPLAMIPNSFFFMKSFPMSSTGKVDYTLLSSSRYIMVDVCNEIKEVPDSDLLQAIKEAFCCVLMVEKVGNNDDFFAMGGDSISAAHVSHKLGIHMSLLYYFPSPYKLLMTLLEQEETKNSSLIRSADNKGDLKALEQSELLSVTPNVPSPKPCARLFSSFSKSCTEAHPDNVLKWDNINPTSITAGNGCPWISISKNIACSFGRCNRVMVRKGYESNTLSQATWFHKPPRQTNSSMQEMWKVHMESCVDASPLVVVRGGDIYLYIGSHSQKFLCINANSGSVQWEIRLEGRVECSAAILDDFSEVVVGCYRGNIYFVSSLDGSISWTFQTGGEVKSQPVVDQHLHLVWCGSYDHNLYALDYISHCCIFKLPCGGSIYGSPAIDEVCEKLYVASTNGRLTSLSTEGFPFRKLWLQDLGAPIFGSLSINRLNGNVICCLVNGHVVSLDVGGSIIWRGITGGPIFAGPCISHVLHSQVLICSRDGSIYSFELENGNLLWEHNLGDPITSSAYVDEHLKIVSGHAPLSDKFICVCGSSGCIYLFRISLESFGEANLPKTDVVQEFARFGLQGDIFSSPVMIGGRIFVGCRDDYVHCIGVEGQISLES